MEKPPPLDPRYLKWPVQDTGELAVFVQFVRDQNIKSYLEIGAKYGGSFWHVVTAMPKGSLAVAVDLPYGSTFKRPMSEPYLRECIKELRTKGYAAHLILGDSTSEKVINDVRQRAPYDLCLIDANHTEAYVRADWANYGPMAKIVAFHDISYDMSRNHVGKIFPIEVPKVWNEIKVGYRHQEIKLCHTKSDNGFGILWH
jgi:Methyltransferase domain